MKILQTSLMALPLLFSVALAKDSNCQHAVEPIGTVRQVYDGRLYPDIQVNTFRNIDRLFPTRTVQRGDTVLELPENLRSFDDFVFSIGERSYDLYDVLALNRVSGLLIIQNKKILFEKYLLGNSSETRWMSMSIVKSITATLIGAAIKDGAIRSIDDHIVTYLPRFKGSAYDGVTVRHLLQMTSGVAWNEAYTDPDSDRRRMLDAQIGQRPGDILDLMAALPRAAEPGTRWNYSTGETHVAGALVAAATGKSVAEYLSEKIWKPFGMEADANWWLESPDGLEVGGSGLSATLRDYGRFGLFMLGNGEVNGQTILPAGWMENASTPKVVAGEKIPYGYMLWPLHDRSYAAIGIFGQFVFVDPDRDLVVAMWSAQSKPVGKHGLDEYEFLEALSDYLE
jgi:CubicO group peptidase (beta-lactamase class C family)